MARTIPLSITLGAAHTGESIGYTVLNLDRTTYSAFTTTDVAESGDVAGTYYVDGGITVPDAGCYIIAGISGTDYAETAVDPVSGPTILDSVPVTAPAGVATTLSEMIVQLWRRNFKKVVLTTTDLYTYADDGSTIITTQAVSDNGSQQVQGAAS